MRSPTLDQGGSAPYLWPMFVVSASTVMNPAALETRSVPKRLIGRVAILPRRGAGPGLWLRLLFEVQILRFLIPLLPFVLALLIWPDMALAISQAPLPMVLAIGFVELKVLAIKPAARAALISDDVMARGLDALRFNARRVLTQIAAGRDMTEGELVLVIEQSELARITPLTLVSVQESFPEPGVLTLTPEERALLTGGIFDDQLTERVLHRIGLRQDDCLHRVALDAASVSAHARMAARLVATTPGPLPAPTAQRTQ